MIGHCSRFSTQVTKFAGCFESAKTASFLMQSVHTTTSSFSSSYSSSGSSSCCTSSPVSSVVGAVLSPSFSSPSNSLPLPFSSFVSSPLSPSPASSSPAVLSASVGRSSCSIYFLKGKMESSHGTVPAGHQRFPLPSSYGRLAILKAFAPRLPHTFWLLSTPMYMVGMASRVSHLVESARSSSHATP